MQVLVVSFAQGSKSAMYDFLVFPSSTRNLRPERNQLAVGRALAARYDPPGGATVPGGYRSRVDSLITSHFVRHCRRASSQVGRRSASTAACHCQPARWAVGVRGSMARWRRPFACLRCNNSANNAPDDMSGRSGGLLRRGH